MQATKRRPEPFGSGNLWFVRDEIGAFLTSYGTWEEFTGRQLLDHGEQSSDRVSRFDSEHAVHMVIVGYHQGAADAAGAMRVLARRWDQ